MTDNTLATQQKADINLVAGRACERGSSAIAIAASQALKNRAIHLLETPPEIALEMAPTIDDSPLNPQGAHSDPIHGRPSLTRGING